MKRRIGAVVFAVGSLLASTFCLAWEFPAHLSVKEKLHLKGSRRPIELSPQTYEIEVEVHTVLRRITLELDHKSYRFNFPKRMVIPTTSGTVVLQAGGNGQDVNLTFHAETDTHVGSQTTSEESCVYRTITRTRTVCSPGGGCAPETYTDTIYGSQLVTQHNEYDTHFYTVDLGTQAQAKGVTEEVRTIEDYRTSCAL